MPGAPRLSRMGTCESAHGGQAVQSAADGARDNTRWKRDRCGAGRTRAKGKEPRLAAGRVRGSPPLTRLGLFDPEMSGRPVGGRALREFVFRENWILDSLRRPVGMIQTPPLSHPPGGLLDENPLPCDAGRTQFSREHEIQLRSEEDPCCSPLRGRTIALGVPDPGGMRDFLSDYFAIGYDTGTPCRSPPNAPDWKQILYPTRRSANILQTRQLGYKQKSRPNRERVPFLPIADGAQLSSAKP